MYIKERSYFKTNWDFLMVHTVKVKVMWSSYRPRVAQKASRGIALLYHARGTRRWWMVISTHRPHFTPGKTRYPFDRRMGGPQGRSGRAENLVATGIRSRTVQPVFSRYTDWATGPTKCNDTKLTWGVLSAERVWRKISRNKRGDFGYARKGGRVLGGKSETSVVQTNLSIICRTKGEPLAKFVRSRHGNEIGRIRST